MKISWNNNRGLSSFQIILLGFAGMILAGALLLMLPISSRSGRVTPFHEALFTATSAGCVTGLVVQDTASYWSVFGQSVILLLIQVGGLGVITTAIALALLSGKRINLRQRSTLQESISAPEVGGIVRLTRFILRTTLLFELAGAVAMLPVFCADYGGRGIWLSVFHSISAFCNAGFDLLGTAQEPYASLTRYGSNGVLNGIVMLLILAGGIGFLTWEDISTKKFRIRQYRMQSKVVLLTSGLLILFPALWFFFVDFTALPLKQRILYAIFQAVTPRTAGFNTAQLTQMSGAGRGIMIVLMLIGGSPGSTAGGMKTTTLAVLLVNAVAVFRRREDTELFGRRLEARAIRNASTILVMYGTLFFTGAVIISAAEGLSFGTCLFETASAIGTVGLTLGITPGLGLLSQLVLIFLMFLGRVGGLTIIFAASSGTKIAASKLPQEKITVG